MKTRNRKLAIWMQEHTAHHTLLSVGITKRPFAQDANFY